MSLANVLMIPGYGGRAFTPLSLFSSGEVGAWYDPSDLSTLFQDAGGTTPVTADGQSVRLMRDKSGNNNHATAPSDAARPLYKTSGGLHWLQPDGVDDAMGCNYAHAAATTSVGIAITRKADGTANNSTPALTINSGSSRITGFTARNTFVLFNSLDIGNITASSVNMDISVDATAVLIGDFGPVQVARKNGVVTGSPAQGQVYGRTVTTLNVMGFLGLGFYSTAFFYGGVVRTILFTAAEKTKLESYLAAKSGVTL